MISDLLLDINIVVDICARRHPYFVDAAKHYPPPLPKTDA
jgi:ribosomal protein L31